MSTVTLTFNNIGTEDETVIVELIKFYTYYAQQTFKPIRLGSEQTVIGASTTQQASFFAQAWNLDYSGTLGTAVAFGNQVTITLSLAAFQVVSVTGTAIVSGDVSAIFNNSPVEADQTLVVTGFTAYAPDRCTQIYINFTATGGTESFNVYWNDVLMQSAQTSPMSLLVPRNINGVLKVKDTLGADIGTLVVSPPVKIAQNAISVDVVNLSAGATMTISVTSTVNNLPLEYSIDTVPTSGASAYQSANVFTSLTPATYIIFVKDVYGCITQSSNIVVDGVTTVTETVFAISDINSLRFSAIQSGKKNHKNTLSINEVRQIAYPFKHKYLQTDLIQTQFKTNAQYINAFTMDCDGINTSIVPIKRTENIGIEAKSTCTMYSLGGGRSAIYFGIVDILDYLSETVIEQKNYGFTLPPWANTVGNYVFINGIGELQIDAIGYSDLYDTFVIELNYTYTGTPVAKVLSAIYNIQPYEVYEFTIDMNIEPENFYVGIEVGSDANNITHQYVSEAIQRVEDSDKLIKIEYWDEENKGNMVYQTGISHLLRLEGDYDYVGDQKTEGYDGDSDYFVTNNVIYDSQKFAFYRLNGEMAHKMRLVVAHQNLKVNGLFYKLSEVPEITGSKTNNFKVFSVILKRSGDQFLTNENEYIPDSLENEAITSGIEASQGKAMILWTKNNG